MQARSYDNFTLLLCCLVIKRDLPDLWGIGHTVTSSCLSLHRYLKVGRLRLGFLFSLGAIA